MWQFSIMLPLPLALQNPDTQTEHTGSKSRNMHKLSSRNQSSMMMPEEEEERQSGAFLELKEYCLQLLQLLRNPNNKGTISAISHLLHFLRRSSPNSLQPFFDFTLLPLVLLLEAAVNSRSPPKSEITEKPPKISDAVAEGVLQCLQELLMKCHLQSIHQMVLVLKHLTKAASLSPSEASEEFREGVILCFKLTLLLGLCPCSNKSCKCNKINGLPMLLEEIHSNSFLEVNTDECLLAFLQSQSATEPVGVWLSLLLKVADVEAGRGHIGSSKIRVEAFKTLRILVAKVGTPDQLAFFLPGVVSQIAKVLHMSKTMISGAAGSTEAVDQALRGLTEFLIIVLQDKSNMSSLDDNSGIDVNTNKSPLSYLEELRRFPFKKNENGQIVATKSTQDLIVNTPSQSKGNDNIKSMYVERTKDWMKTTSSRVNELLSSTFPHLCVHQSKKVRLGTMAAIQGLLSNCSHTLKGSRLMLLECLCALVSDDDEDVSSTAQMFLRKLFSSSGKHHIEHDLVDIFNRLFEKLPEVIIGGHDSHTHCQKLLVIIYYSGPQLVKEHLLQSPVTAARFFDTLTLCLSQNSVFSGSLDKLLLERPSSVGYLRSITEMKATTFFSNENNSAIESNSYEENHNSLKTQIEYELPRMPPWFSSSSSQKLYQALSRILRLVSLSLVSGCDGNLSIMKDIPLSYLRKLISDVRKKEYTKENWETWYNNSGKLVRQASTSACILNEMMFGLSDEGVDDLKKKFHKDDVADMFGWNVKGIRSQLIECIGSILHEYLSPEIWNLPLEKSKVGDGDVNVHFFNDNAILHQVIIDGIGIFNLSLKTDFISNGFLHSSLYVLLENLICSDFQVKRASDAVLHVISSTSNYPSVGHLVLADSDYVIDSICRQLRHLDLNPHVPNVLAAILSYIGVAHKILPLMEEPMRSISKELEILGRHQHPELTISFLKAVAEIGKAAKVEASSLPSQAELYHRHVEKQNKDQLEEIYFKLKESKSYRQTVGSISSFCITAATPLLSSMKQTACLVALEIVQDGIIALSNVEESYKHEMKTREVLVESLQSNSLHELADTLKSENDTNEENRLLPAINKIWPFLIACIRNNNPLTTRKCAGVISKAVQICGGDFFTRRFHKDGPHIWNLLRASPFAKNKTNLKEQKLIHLPYRKSPVSSNNNPTVEISDLKVQVAILHMISEIAANKKSASAFDSVVKKVSAMAVGIACSGVVGVRDAAVSALRGVKCVDSDLVWLLLADVYYSKKREVFSPPVGVDLPLEVVTVTPPLDCKRFLYVEYGGQSYGFDVDFSAVEFVFKKLYSEDF